MIYLSDVGRAVPQLPDNLRGLPFDTLFAVVLDRIIDHQVLVAAARRQHLDDNSAVKRDIDRNSLVSHGLHLDWANAPAVWWVHENSSPAVVFEAVHSIVLDVTIALLYTTNRHRYINHNY